MHSSLICFLLVLLLSAAANAATYTVTNNGDAATGGTLRWAITNANNNAGRDIIEFNLSGSTTISPASALPSLSDLSQEGTVIDGTTQPGYSDAPIVRLVGTNAGLGVSGLFMNTSSNVVKGLIVTMFRGSGISVGAGVDNLVSGCHVVSNASDGIYIWGGQRAQIGGASAAARNVISSNGSYGVSIQAGAGTEQNVIEGNYIGVDPSGLTARGNRFDGVSISAPGNRVGGTDPGARNVISGNGYNGVYLSGINAHDNVIEGNYIGVNAGGTVAVANAMSGVQLWGGASSNTMSRNVLSGNVSYGIGFDEGCRGNSVLGNFIGTDAAGIGQVSNRYEGISIARNCGGTQIGGTNAGDRNVISGNGYRGIFMHANTGIVIRGNFIGVSTNGTRLGNGMQGIYMQYCKQIAVGGTNEDARNVIAGNYIGLEMYFCVSNTVQRNYVGLNEAGAAVSNTWQGVYVEYGGGHDVSDNILSGNGTRGIELLATTNCVLKRNGVGTDPSGAARRGNGEAGLFLNGGAANNRVGGRWLDEGNVFSGNALYGIVVQDATTVSNVFRGNRVGADASGFLALPNDYGFWIYGAPYNAIGSTNADERNVISGNDIVGIDIVGANSHDNLVVGNYIGVDATGVSPLPNISGGIEFNVASSNQVGGAGTGSVNRIAYNGGSGVQVTAGDGNLILNNSIFRNGVLGIDLGTGTPTANDSGDADGGPNRQQNFPVLVSVSNDGSQIRVVWTLDSVPSQPFIVEFYGSRGPGRLGRGDGDYSLGSVGPLVTPPAGLLGGTNVFPTPTMPPNFISALARHADLHDTSEFSQRIILDSDNDGMADGYEATYFGGYTGGAPDGQADGDQVPNIEEFWWDTNPIDYGSFPRVKSIAAAGTILLTAKCSRDRSYQLFVCTNLNAFPQLWVGRSELLTYEGEDGRFSIPATNRANFRIRATIP